MSILGPDYGLLGLADGAPRIWPGGPSENCWRMYWNPDLGQWELDGGGGLIRYTQSSTFDCNGPNLFDVKLFDYTFQGPESITVYPLSPLPCTCPGLLEIEQGYISLTPYPPGIRKGLDPAHGVLALTGSAPKISTGVLHSVACCPSGVADTLNFTVTGTDCPCLNGTYSMTFASTDPFAPIALGPAWYSPAFLNCGAIHNLRWTLNCDTSVVGHTHWTFSLRYESGFGVVQPHQFPTSTTCGTPPLDNLPWVLVVSTASFPPLVSSGCTNPSNVTVQFF